MNDIGVAFASAFSMVAGFDKDLAEIVALSLGVSLSAVLIAAVIGLPLGAATALFRFPSRKVIVVILNAFMGLPPVVVGLIVYLLLSRAGPFGVLGLLFTPPAMIIAQVILVTPIIASLSLCRPSSRIHNATRLSLLSASSERSRRSRIACVLYR